MNKTIFPSGVFCKIEIKDMYTTARILFILTAPAILVHFLRRKTKIFYFLLKLLLEGSRIVILLYIHIYIVV